ncbi:MAG: hypothetical protein U0793_22880 [Gemmataceae bacterium]
MSGARILMCPPTYYAIEYEINPWMSRGGAVAERAAQRQGLHDILAGLGVDIERMTPQPGLPDLAPRPTPASSTATASSAPRFATRCGARETPHFDAWFAGHGFTVEHLPEGTYFEGAGDALFCGKTLFAGYRIRSDARHQYIGEARLSGAAPGTGRSALLSSRYLLRPLASARRSGSRPPSTATGGKSSKPTCRG